MAFESGRLARLDAPIEVARIEARLAALPYVWRDPVAGRLFHVSATAREARAALAARLADPSRFPDGVLLRVEPDGVGIDQRPGAGAMARARAFVAELLSEGRWSWRDEWGEHGLAHSVDALWPGPLPDPDALDDPLALPVEDGVVLRWQDSEGLVEVHSGGTVRCSLPDGRQRRGRLAPERRARWLAAAVDPGDFDFEEAEDDALVRLDRDTPDDESSAAFRADRVPRWASLLAAEIAELRAAIAGWTQHQPPPPGLASIGDEPGAPPRAPE